MEFGVGFHRIAVEGCFCRKYFSTQIEHSRMGLMFLQKPSDAAARQTVSIVSNSLKLDHSYKYNSIILVSQAVPRGLFVSPHQYYNTLQKHTDHNSVWSPQLQTELIVWSEKQSCKLLFEIIAAAANWGFVLFRS